MKAATFVFLLSVCSTVIPAQTNSAPSGDVTIVMSEGTPEYCLGDSYRGVLQGTRGPDDITLRLPLKLRYENHRSETIILSSEIHRLTRMTVAGQNGFTILRNMGGGGMDVKAVMAMSRPDTRQSPFLILSGRKGDASTVLDWAQCLSATDPGCMLDFVAIPVLDRSSGLDLRGRTIQIVTTRDFRSLTPEVVEKLNEKWKEYGTVWAGIAESNTVTLYIPKEPLTRDCRVPLPQ